MEAFHLVDGSRALRQILEKGFISPAIERVDPNLFREGCIADIERTQNYDGIPETIEAILKLLERNIQSLSHFQSLHGFLPGKNTKLECWDFMAGDSAEVFMSAYDWLPGETATGFVFPADLLIEMGARVRPYDFLGDYRGAAMEVLRHEFRTQREAQEMLLKEFDRIQRAELSGAKAIRFLQRNERALGNQDIEIVWGGPLDVSFAVEVWENGDELEIS